ncbi:MAG: ABC transporter substrate-binding protein [Methanomassiliicoccaceae archaeon]|jgi:ABC-type nitrate/sulfonate/bicarbonate transport system substrate-binding protein|nr:ABC transporter substrate-binding protein [Methanomassiliicoccaceae archaeon]
MNKNATVIIVVGLLVFFTLGTGFIVMSNSSSDEGELDINIIAKANINGSGIFAKGKLSITPGTQEEINAWGGKLFMTPGASSIQHNMLNKFVTEDLGLKFVMYTSGSLSPDTVYWIAVAPMNMLNTLKLDDRIEGGFPWEPFFSEIVLTYPSFETAITSEEMEKNHPCCMVAAKASFLKNNEGAVLRFLTAYTESLDWVNKALSDLSSGDYINLLKMTSEFTNITDLGILSAAFSNMTYMYNLVDSSGAETLEKYTEKLIKTFESLNIITKRVNDPAAFANQFINHTYLDKVLNDKPTFDISKRIKIKVGHLAGDIHQIGFVVGMKLNMFSNYGLDITTIMYANGPAVMQAFQFGIIDIGILGLPPAVSGTANFR